MRVEKSIADMKKARRERIALGVEIEDAAAGAGQAAVGNTGDLAVGSGMGDSPMRLWRAPLRQTGETGRGVGAQASRLLGSVRMFGDVGLRDERLRDARLGDAGEELVIERGAAVEVVVGGESVARNTGEPAVPRRGALMEGGV